MQSIPWYFQRLKSMSAGEIAWRVSGLSRDWLDRGRFSLGVYPKLDKNSCGESPDAVPRGFSLQRNADDFAGADVDGLWLPKLVATAEKALVSELSYFNQKERFLGDPINWHRDHNSDVQTSRQLIQRIDYRDFARNGDCKQVWEPNRHHQFVVTARAYAATGENRFAEATVQQMHSWIQANPFGYGMNWRSPLELGVRLINWVIAIELVRDSGLLKGQVWQEIYTTVYLHCWEISRKLSKGSSANNHLVGELAGLYVATRYFPGMPDAKKWSEISWHGLQREISLQSYSDGCTREQALGYQFFVIQFYLICGLAGNWSDNEFSPEYWSRLNTMMEFIARMGEFGPLPMFGDQDDGYVLDLGNAAGDISALMDLGSYVFAMSPRATSMATASESAYWLFGPQAARQKAKQGSDSVGYSKALPESGYYLLQHKDANHCVSVVSDCAELGYGPIAAHGHADALAITLRADNEYVLVDPGTFDYFSHPNYRNYFRSTAAHNTIRIDGRDQSIMHGPFMWGHQARSKCTEFTCDAGASKIVSEHDGYRTLNDPVIHRRSVQLQHDSYNCQIEDEIIAQDAHDIEVFFHFGPACKLLDLTDDRLRIDVAGRFYCDLSVDPSLTVKTYHGSEEPIAGWYSAGYHQKTAITTVVATGRLAAGILRHRLQLVWER